MVLNKKWPKNGGKYILYSIFYILYASAGGSQKNGE